MTELADLMQERLHAIGADDQTTALLDAMLLGRRQGLTPQLRRLYADAGAAHVLAVSGMHLSVVFGLLQFWAIRMFQRAWVRWLLAAAAIGLLWTYAMVTGLPVSVVRASIMMSLMVLCHARLHSPPLLHTLCVAAVIILIVEPHALRSVSFQLSVASVAGIAVYCTQLRPAHKWQSALLACLGAQLASAPLVAYYFHQLSTYSVVMSLAYVVMATLILAGSLIGIALGPIMAWPLTVMVGVQHAMMSFASSLPGALVTGLYPSVGQVVLCYAALVTLALMLRAKVGGAVLYELWPYAAAMIVALGAVVLIN